MRLPPLRSPCTLDDHIDNLTYYAPIRLARMRSLLVGHHLEPVVLERVDG
jgi:hypothetical protein